MRRWLYLSINDNHIECIRCQVSLETKSLTKSLTDSLWSAANLHNGNWKTQKGWLRKVTVFGNMYQSEETLTLDKTWERWCPSCCPVSVLISNWGIVPYLSGSFFRPQLTPAETCILNCRLYQNWKKKGLKTACNLVNIGSQVKFLGFSLKWMGTSLVWGCTLVRLEKWMAYLLKEHKGI